MGTTQTVPAFRIIWPSGEKMSARSATEFILRSAKAQWSETSFEEMKQQFSQRALAWSGKFIHPAQGDEPFLMELARVGFLTLYRDGEKVVPRG